MKPPEGLAFDGGFWFIVKREMGRVKRKQGSPERVVAPEIMQEARRSLHSDKVKPAAKKCFVCGAPVAPNSAEGLCWVCRRLKISAWQEVDQQISAQE